MKKILVTPVTFKRFADALKSTVSTSDELVEVLLQVGKCSMSTSDELAAALLQVGKCLKKRALKTSSLSREREKE